VGDEDLEFLAQRSVALRDPVWQLAPPRRKFSSVIQRRFRKDRLREHPQADRSRKP
jgi:hypothetical protein